MFVKDADCLGLPLIRKQMQLRTGGRTLSLETEEWLSVKWLIFWESHLGRVIAWWKTKCTSYFCQICAFFFFWVNF